jgi:hypothetical protein
MGTHVQNSAFYSLPYDVLHAFVPSRRSAPFRSFSSHGRESRRTTSTT